MIRGIIYLGGEVFSQIDLHNKEWRLIYKSKAFDSFEFPNKFKDSIFILERGGTRIQYYDIKRNDFEFIADGRLPLYIKESNSIFYNKGSEGLFSKKLDGTSNEFIAGDIYGRPIQISDSEIVYYNKDKKIEKYNFINKTFRVLDIIGYSPWAFYNKKKWLICKNEEDNNFYFINILTSEKEKVYIKDPKLVKWCIIPIGEYNCLIYSKIRVVFIAEYEDMFIYWIDKKKEELFLKNHKITSGVYAAQGEIGDGP